MISEEMSDAWFAAGKFEELAECFRLAAQKGRSPRAAFQFGRGLMLTGRVDEAEAWFRRAYVKRPLRARLKGGSARHPWTAVCLTMLGCFDGAALGEIVRRGAAAGLSPQNWFVLALLVAARVGTTDDALAIVRQFIPAAALPLRALSLVAASAPQGSPVSDALVEFVIARPFDQQQVMLLDLLRKPYLSEDVATLGRLLKIADRFQGSKIRDELIQLGKMFEALPSFRSIPIIGEDLAAVMRVKAMRRLSAALGLDPADSLDEFPLAARLIPVSVTAREEWKALMAAKSKS